MIHNILESKVAAIICRNITNVLDFQDVRCFDSKSVLLVKIDGHLVKISVADLGDVQ